MITDGKNYHYLAITNLSALLQENSSNHRGDFNCLNCFSSYITKNKLKEHEEICNNHSKCSLNYKVPKDIPIIIHNASYDTHFIINQLAEELKSKLKGGLLTVLDLCRLHYQNLLITCLEFLIV